MRLKLVVLFLTLFSICVVSASRPEIALNLDERETSGSIVANIFPINIKDLCSSRQFATIEGHQYVRVGSYEIYREDTPSFSDCTQLVPKHLSDGSIVAVDDGPLLLRELLSPGAALSFVIGEVYSKSICDEAFQIYPMTVSIAKVCSLKMDISPVTNHAFFKMLLMQDK